MVKLVIWSRVANVSKNEILDYWIKRNQSNKFSKNLGKLFKEAVEVIAQFPLAGKPTSRVDIRIKIVKEYLIFIKYHKTKY
jgi:toxin YoeB